jgi:hypothetical protein
MVRIRCLLPVNMVAEHGAFDAWHASMLACMPFGSAAEADAYAASINLEHGEYMVEAW